MVAGIVLLALGLKKTLEDVGAGLDVVIASAMLGGVALYLLAHVAHRYRNIHTVNYHRLVYAVVLLALIPVAVEMRSCSALAGMTAILWVLVGPRRSGSRARASRGARRRAAH